MIDIKFGALFPWQFRLVGFVLMLSAVAFIQTQLWVSILLVLAGMFILLSYEGTEVNINTKTYREYTSFFFIKTGKFLGYSQAEQIYLTKSKQSQQIYTAHTNQSSTFSDTLYNAYLKLSPGKKIHLCSQKNKNSLLEKLSPLSEKLKVDIVDYT